MAHSFYALLFGALFHSGSAALCDSVSKTTDPVLFIQGSQRCLWISPTSYTTWTAAMNFCISQNGYLAHIYTSDDKNEIMAWYNTSTKKTQNMYFGLLKDSGHTITDGSQVHWVTSLTNKVVDEFKYFYKSFIYNWGTASTKSLILKYPGAVFNFENPSSGYAVCERASKRMQDYFDDWPGKYFGESQLVSQTVANVNAHTCAKLCAKKLQCQSFNLMTYGSATACEIFDINKTDSGIAKLIVNASHTYYKRTFA